MYPGQEEIPTAQNLSSKIFGNYLILTRILGRLPLQSLYPLRQVCKLWKGVIDTEISQHFTLKMKRDKTWLANLPKHLDFMKKMKIRKITIEDWPMGRSISANILIFQALNEIGPEITEFRIQDLVIETQADSLVIETLILAMPNLEKLDLKWSKVPDLTCFQNSFTFHQNTRFWPCWSFPLIMVDDVEDFVLQTLNKFPKLYKNFDHAQLDASLFQLMSQGKVRVPFLKEIEIQHDLGLTIFTSNEKQFDLNVIKTLPLKDFPNLRVLKISMPNHLPGYPNQLLELLKHFSPILETLELQCLFNMRGEGLIHIPPCPKLREMCLGFPPVFEGKPGFKWNLGRNLANDFPLLEILILGFDSTDSSDDFLPSFSSDAANKFDFPKSLEILEPFVPLCKENVDVDLSPLKFLKYVNLSVPTKWMGVDENVFWGKAFLNVYLKLYGAASRSTIQPMIDWLT